MMVVQSGPGRAPRNDTPEIVALDHFVVQAALLFLQIFVLVFEVVIYEAEQEAFQQSARVI